MNLSFVGVTDPAEIDIRTTVRTQVDTLLRPYAIEDDEKSFFRKSAFDALTKLKLHAIAVPKEYGGLGLSYGCYYATMEEIARASVAMSVTVGVTNLVQGALLAYGSPEQKENFLKRMVKGELLGAFSLSEPQSGSDAAGLRCSAKKADGGYRLTGTKVWCSTAGHADVYLVMARTGEDKYRGITAFLVSKEASGFRVGKMEKKLGIHASTLAELIFEDCFVPEAQRIGKEGEGFNVALSQLDAGRITIGAAGLAITIESLEKFGKFIQKHPDSAIQHWELLADHYALAQSVRLLIKEASKLRDEKKPFTAIASQIKLLGSDLAMRTASDVITLMGAPGYTREWEVERLFRDAKSLQIVEGTNQIQRLVLARELETMSKTK